MGSSYTQRLRWAFPATQAAQADVFKKTADAGPAPGDTRTPMERTLDQIGLPIGSTDEARSSPLLEARDLLR